MDPALAVWARLDRGQFSPRTQALLDELERPLGWLDSGLSAATALPKLLGASSDGPKTYLLLVQNEDELRPTGGFITAIGTFVIQNGTIFGLEFEDSGDQEDWALPYPEAPWQLRDYMNSPVLVLRDANWFTDYPTSVNWIEYLYAYKHQHSLDGVIAIDQQTLVDLLGVIGPLALEVMTDPITAANVVELYAGSQEKGTVKTDGVVIRKPFIAQMANAVLQKLTSGSGEVDWTRLAESYAKSLAERHMLLQFDDPKIISRPGRFGMGRRSQTGSRGFFDGGGQQHWFQQDQCCGQSKITYDVDLTQPQNPTGTLALLQTNRSPSTRSCIQFGGHEIGDKYPIDYCYWNYLRVYVPAGTRLTGASPHPIPADWMLLQQAVPARVDTLEEDPRGAGLRHPGGGARGADRDTRFTFALPARVIVPSPGPKNIPIPSKSRSSPARERSP